MSTTKRFRAASPPDTEMSSTNDDEENLGSMLGLQNDGTSSFQPEATHAAAADVDVEMSPPDDVGYQTSQGLVNDTVKNRIAQTDISGLLHKHVSLAAIEDTDAVTSLRNLICEACLCAFKNEYNTVHSKGNDLETIEALCDASLDFLKNQQHRLNVNNDMKLYGFLTGFWKDALNDYYERKAEQDHLKVESSTTLGRMVPVDYLISATKLSHDCDVQNFVLQAEEVAKWSKNAEEAAANSKHGAATSSYEDAPYFCVVQSSGMGKTKIIFEGCKRLQNDRGWSCFIVLPSALKDSRRLAAGKVFSRVLDLEWEETPRSGKDAATETLRKLNSWYEDLMRDSDLYSNETIIFLCFDEAQLYLKSLSFEDGKVHAAFLFRCIRLWLRQKGRRHRVVGCFCGTTATLASFRLEADPNLLSASSRDFTPQEYTFYEKGEKVFPVFLQTTTMGCLAGGFSSERSYSSEYDLAIGYGRPLFELMRANGHLSNNEGVILRRMLLYGLGNDWKAGKENLKACLSILGTRVQMGQTSFPIMSEMVGYGYANLTYATSTDAKICYMPDPVCGCLAMKMMDQQWASGEITGRGSSWWLSQMKKIFSQGLCRPEKGDFGEIMVALYFLFCSDVLRRKRGDGYQTFSVPLGDWIEVLKSGGFESRKAENLNTQGNSFNTRKSNRLRSRLSITKTDVDASMDKGCELQATISFIQVCRSYLRSYGVDWEGLCSQKFLLHIYNSGTAFYVYPGCPIIDLVAPIKLSGKDMEYFAPMVISIKAHAYYAPAYARGVCRQMTEQFENIQDRFGKESLEFFPGALCLLVVLGSTAFSDDEWLALEKSDVGELAQKKVVSRVLRIPKEDVFGGFCKTFHTLTSETSRGVSELFASHSFVRAYSNDDSTEELEGEFALRACAGSEELGLLQNLCEQFKDRHSMGDV